MKTLVLSSIFATFVAVAAFAPAMAADAVTAPPAPPIAEQVPVFTWTGPYAGIRGGGSWVDGDFDFPGGSASQHFNGGLIGGFLGYNWQMDNNVVIGAEGDLNYNWNKEEIVPGVDGGTDVDGSVRARVGYAFDKTLVYATGGWQISRGYLDAGDGKETKTFNGWTLGAGVDHAFTNNIFGRVEYRYTDFGSKDIGNTNVDLNQNAVVVGVGVKF
ncbi:outer membrane protein [Rhizobium sp. BK376]|uniref:outer membrane protein n=1 Tax=Rhizobium sp. BK376 TaxID=2512149 RepID=UPI0010470205|nr:outer membrane protein [Rhizobium sp. BK376]TCR91927.1 outer membrane immunogenic protein [Rhizobium sp. BK376]